MSFEHEKGKPEQVPEQPDIEAEGDPAASIDRRVAPWPAGHTPRTDCERELWLSFEELRIDPASRLTQQKVAERVGRSRTSISIGRDDGYELLRNAIKKEVLRRKQSRPARSEALEVKTPEERAARREGTINYYKDLEQRAASALVEARVRVVRAEQAVELHKKALKAIFMDLRSGKWVRTDGNDTDAVTGFQAFLADMLTANASDEPSDAAISGSSAPHITGVKPPVHNAKPWRNYR